MISPQLKSLLILVILCPFYLNAQDSLSVIASKYIDSFVEWEIYNSVDDESPSGELTMRWAMEEDWTQWDYRIGEVTGDIRTKWRESFDEWQLTSEGETIIMKVRWPGDYSEWRITDNDDQHIFSVVNVNAPEEWELKYNKETTFQVYTEFEGDMRSWLVYEEGKALSQPLRMAMSFIAIMASVPKY